MLRYVQPDTTAPTVTLASTPPASTTQTSAGFAFTASEAGVAFECLLDGGGYTGCVSPASYQSLGVGTHSFAVRARDAAGNVGEPATYSWSIVTPPPPPPPPLADLYVASLTKNTIIVRNGGNAAAGVSSILRITVGSSLLRERSPCRRSRRALRPRSPLLAASALISRPSTKRTSSPSRTRRNNTASLTNRTCPDLVGLDQGLELIAAGEFFAAHEELEDEWREAPPEERDFLQGLVHVAVAWYQAGRGRRPGCERQLEKAARRLGPYAPHHRGVDVAATLGSVAAAQELVARGDLQLPAPRL